MERREEERGSAGDERREGVQERRGERERRRGEEVTMTDMKSCTR